MKGSNMETEQELVFNDNLQCYLQGARIDGKKTCYLYLSEHSVASMTGAIKVASFLLPSVERIITMAHNNPDTMYKKENGKWKAYDMRRKLN